MMKMATGEGSPLRQGAETGLDWFSVATEASGGGTTDLFSILEVLGYGDIYGCRKYVGGATGAPQVRGRALGGGRTPTLVGSPCLPRRALQVPWVAFLPKITPLVDFVPFRLCLIFLFFD